MRPTVVCYDPRDPGCDDQAKFTRAVVIAPLQSVDSESLRVDGGTVVGAAAALRDSQVSLDAVVRPELAANFGGVAGAAATEVVLHFSLFGGSIRIGGKYLGGQGDGLGGVADAAATEIAGKPLDDVIDLPLLVSLRTNYRQPLTGTVPPEFVAALLPEPDPLLWSGKFYAAAPMSARPGAPGGNPGSDGSGGSWTGGSDPGGYPGSSVDGTASPGAAESGDLDPGALGSDPAVSSAAGGSGAPAGTESPVSAAAGSGSAGPATPVAGTRWVSPAIAEPDAAATQVPVDSADTEFEGVGDGTDWGGSDWGGSDPDPAMNLAYGAPGLTSTPGVIGATPQATVVRTGSNPVLTPINQVSGASAPALTPRAGETEQLRARASTGSSMGYLPPGMRGGAGAGAGGEHTTPGYLIDSEHTSDLVGRAPLTAPPVLGDWEALERS